MEPAPSAKPAVTCQEPKVVEAETENPAPTLAEIEKANIKPHCQVDTSAGEDTTIEASARHIRDSIAILKSNKHHNVSSMITMGWTSDMEKKLLKLAAEYNHDFELVASSLQDDHGSKHITFDEKSCHRRWSLLDLSAEENIAEEEAIWVFPSTEKALSCFSNPDGKRKSIEELRLGDEAVRLVLAPDLPDTDDLSTEYVGDDNPVHRGELWEQLESASCNQNRQD